MARYPLGARPKECPVRSNQTFAANRRYHAPVIPQTAAALFFESSAPSWHGLSADNWIKMVAVAVGAAWTLLNFVRGRTYRKRLETEISGNFSDRPGVILFTGDYKAKNLGSSEIPVLARGTGVYLFSLWLRRYTDGGWGVAEELINTVSLVEKDAWIEPTETLRKMYILPIPSGRGEFVGVRSEVQINNGKTMWTVSHICEFQRPTDTRPTSGVTHV